MPEPGNRGTAVFKYRIKQNAYTTGKLNIVARVSQPYRTHSLRTRPRWEEFGLGNRDSRGRGIRPVAVSREELVAIPCHFSKLKKKKRNALTASSL